MENNLTDIEKLMSYLIFNDKIEYEIEILKYITDMKDIETFTNNIINNLEIAGIETIEQVLVLTKEKKQWILKLKRD